MDDQKQNGGDLGESADFGEVTGLRANLARREIPSLNGLRAIASLTVVCGHVVDAKFPAGYAVTLFFVLSGFLITLLLSAEFERTGSIDVYGFYSRRIRRLAPAYYVWILAAIVVSSHEFTGELRAAAFYMSDYYTAWVRRGTFGHTWSLSVEEHFYFLWPMCLVWLIRRSKRCGILLIIVLSIQVLRLLFAAEHPIWFYYSFETRLDGLLVGCALALWLRDNPKPPRLINQRWAWLIPAAAMAGSAILPIVWQQILGETVVAYAAAALIIQVITYPPWILNNPVAKYLGTTSYSLYLYHILVRSVYQKIIPGSAEGIDATFVVHGWVNRFAVIALSLAAASLSYWCIERPILRWSRSAARIMNSDHGALLCPPAAR